MSTGMANTKRGSFSSTPSSSTPSTTRGTRSTGHSSLRVLPRRRSAMPGMSTSMTSSPVLRALVCVSDHHTASG